MILKQYKNTTMKITYAGKQFLLDPTFELPLPIEEIVDVDALILTGVSAEYFDASCLELFPQTIKIYVPSEAIAEQIKAEGYTDVTILQDYGLLFDDVWVVKIPSPSDILYNKEAASSLPIVDSCGVILNHLKEGSLYLMGNSLVYEETHDLLYDVSPDITVVNVGNLKNIDDRYLTITSEEIHALSKSAENTTFVASCIKAVHGTGIPLHQLKEYAKENGFSQRFSVLTDGQSLTL